MISSRLLNLGNRLKAGAALLTMPLFVLSALMLLALATVQTGCVGQRGGATAPGIAFLGGENRDVGSAACVGENRVGETCYVYIEPSRGGPVRQSAKVLCGRWEHSSARIFEVKHESASSSLEEWAQKGWWKTDVLGARAQCTPSGKKDKILGGMETLLLECKLKNGGWPYLGLIARSGKATYLADGIPAALEVVERAIGVMSGSLTKTKDVCRGAPTRWILEAMRSDKPYGADDLATYYRLMALGQHYNGVKNFAAAENRYREALTFHRSIAGEGDPEGADPLMHIALELSNQERFEEADVLFAKVEALLPGASDQTDHARFLSYKALHAANQRKFEEARKLAAEATRSRKTSLSKWDFHAQQSVLQSSPVGLAALPQESADIVQSRYIEAAMLGRLGKADEAEDVYREAMSTLSTAESAPSLWTPQLSGLGARIVDSNEVREQRLAKAINLWKLYAAGERPGALDYLAAGENFRAQGRLGEALEAFRTGIDLVAGRGSLRFEQLLPFFRTALELAESHHAQSHDLYKRMFEAGQLVRGSRTRLDIARAAVRLGAQDQDAEKLIRELQEAENETYTRRRAAASESIWGRGKVVKQYQARIDEAIKAGQLLKDKQRQVHNAFPRYNQLIDAVVDAGDALKALQPGEALIQILLGKTESLLFFVRRGGISAHPLGVTEATVNHDVEILRKGIEVSDRGSLEAFDVARSYRLYRQLFSPIAKELDGIEHLITVPTGALLSLPFGLLVTAEPSGKRRRDYTDIDWLAGRSAITLAPSVRSFVELRNTNRSRATKPFVGFGYPVRFTKDLLNKTQPKLSRECLDNQSLVKQYRASLAQLADLPGTERELKRVAENLSHMFSDSSPDLILSADFNEQRVKKHPLQDYRVLYFATHGLLPGQIACQQEPALVASFSDTPQEGEDGLIDAGEILKLKLDADLVVLSACNTGGPGAEKEIRGESLAGLARAFFFAGSRSVLASHWELPDEVTARLMIETFNGLYDESAPKPLAVALNAAQRELMKQRLQSHPFFWAGLSLVGDGGRIVSQKTTR